MDRRAVGMPCGGLYVFDPFMFSLNTMLILQENLAIYISQDYT